ncbi:MAG: TolC family protein [Planctomycetota bacterium]|jgi:cobalt-zinc-cadmium efflux system outer membrane protein
MRLRFLLLTLLLISFSGCAQQPEEMGGQMRAGPRERLGQTSRRAETRAAGEVVEPTGVVTLKQALDLALEHNPELKASYLDISAAEAGRLQASLWRNPKLAVEIEEIGGAGGRSGFDGSETTIAIAQPLEMGRKRARRTALASLEKELAEWDYRAKRLDVTREVTEAFIAVLALQERVALTEELVSVAEQAHSAVTQRVEAGRDSPIEQTKSAVALAAARIEPQRAVRALESARKRLAAAWGSKTARFDAVAGELGKISAAVPGDELGRLVGDNPDVARWQTEKRRRRAALELEEARAMSDIELEGGLQYFNETDDSAVVFGLSIPIAVSDRNQGGIRRATYLLAKAEQNAKAAEIKAFASLEEAVQRLASEYAEATTLNNDVLPGAQSSFDAVSEGYRDGKFDYLQVLDAQRTLFEARGRYIESLTAYHKAKADAERLIGQSIDSIREVHEENDKESK